MLVQAVYCRYGQLFVSSDPARVREKTAGEPSLRMLQPDRLACEWRFEVEEACKYMQHIMGVCLLVQFSWRRSRLL